jgi:uncharacterized Zn-binding protein involved in type VI secretion
MGKPAAKMNDQVSGVDIHIVMVPSPGGPVPTPMPFPFMGSIVDGVSKDVNIEGLPAAVVNSGVQNMPPHIPAPGPFQKPPSNRGKVLNGSTGVFINGKPAARAGDFVMTCGDPVDAPTSSIIAISKVFIGEVGGAAPRPPKAGAGGPGSGVGEGGEPGGQSMAATPTVMPASLKAKWGQQGSIIKIKWKEKTVKAGDEANLSAETKGYDDGTPANFYVWKRKDGNDIFVAQIEREIQGNKAETTRKMVFEAPQAELREVLSDDPTEDYFFSMEVEGEERSSEALKVTYPLEVLIEDEKGNPLDDIECKITLPDKTVKEGKLKHGRTKVEDAPFGKFSLELKDLPRPLFGVVGEASLYRYTLKNIIYVTLVDVANRPIKNVKCKVTLSDGKTLNIQSDENGILEIPKKGDRKFKIEVCFSS